MTTPTERIAAYRSRHLITLSEEEHPSFGRIYRCEVDGLRVHPTRNGRWRHDSAELVSLLDQEYGGPWGQPKTVVVEDHDSYVVTVDEDDEEWTNREGMPEFNGSFR